MLGEQGIDLGGLQGIFHILTPVFLIVSLAQEDLEAVLF